MKITFDNSGQMMTTGMSIAYAFIFLLANIIAVGILIMTLSDNFLGIQMHYYSQLYGVDPTILSYFETARQLIPFAVVINFVLSLLIAGHWLSTWG